MVLKRVKCDLNGVKIAIFAAKTQKSPAGGGSAPSVTTHFSCNDLFSTGPKLDNFRARNIYFWFSLFSLSKTLVALLVAFTSADRFFKRLYGPHTKRAINAAGLICLFFQRCIQNGSFKMSIFMCKSSVCFIVPPIFG